MSSTKRWAALVSGLGIGILPVHRAMPSLSRTGIHKGTGAECAPTSSFSTAQDRISTSSIIDPHGHHLADALPKLRGLADFAAIHGEHFHRIESVARMTNGVLRVLDVTDPNVRDAIAEYNDIETLYLGEQASDY